MHGSTPKYRSTYVLTLMVDDLTESDNFSIRKYFHLTWKYFVTHVHSLVVYVKEGLSEHDVGISLDDSCF